MTSEWLTPEQIRVRSGEEFMKAGGRLERAMALVGSVVSTDRDELWFSAEDPGVDAVSGAFVLGVRVVVTGRVPAGQVWLYSASRGGFVA